MVLTSGETRQVGKRLTEFFFLFIVTFFWGCAAHPKPVPTYVTNLETGEEAPQAAVTELAGPQKENEVKIKIETTLGDIEAVLFAQEVPKTVENFVALANKNFYDGIIFHRVIPGFMIQTGDPTGTGMGDAGYKFKDEFSPQLRHNKAGILSMANAGPNTNGSQFFITLAPTPWLDNKHSVFGEVTQGMDVVEKIGNAERNSQDKPLKEIKMTSVKVLAHS